MANLGAPNELEGALQSPLSGLAVKAVSRQPAAVVQVRMLALVPKVLSRPMKGLFQPVRKALLLGIRAVEPVRPD